MARFHSLLKLTTENPSFSPFSWLWVLLLLCVISLVAAVVGKKHSAVKSKGSGSGRGDGTGKRSAEEVAETEAEQRKKRKEDEEAARAQKQWVTNLKSKGYTCERWVDEYKIGAHEVFEVIAHHCLAFFKDEVPGFRKKVVLNFYLNMHIVTGQHRIESRMNNITVVVTPEIIAAYLKYQRPSKKTITYPKPDSHIDDDFLKNELSEDPSTFEDKFTSGGLKPRYRLINKIVHHNLYPRGKEKTPSLEDGEILYVFGSKNAVVDWALWIFRQMVNFKLYGSANSNMPFPCMITKLCEDAGVKFASSDTLQEPKPGAITKGTVRKSKAASKPPPPATVGSSMPNAKTGVKRQEQWWNISRCNQIVIREDLARIKTELRRRKRNEGKLMRKMDYVVDWIGQSSGGLYVLTKEDKEQTTDEDVGAVAAVTASAGAGSSKKKGVAVSSQSNSDDEEGDDNEEESEEESE